jgi:hypothetical protein
MHEEQIGTTRNGLVYNAARKIHRSGDPSDLSSILELYSVECRRIVRDLPCPEQSIEIIGDDGKSGHARDRC